MAKGGTRSLTELEEWLTRRAEEDERLYAQYGEPLEKEHTGEFAAIGPDGRTIVGNDDTKVLQDAVTMFGSRNFGFFRIGHRALEKWLQLTP